MKKILLIFLLLLFSFINTWGAAIIVDSHSAGGGATTWNITTHHANELIIISAGGYGTGGNSLSTAAGTVTVNGNNATYETQGMYLDPSFSWQADVWAYVAPTAGTYTCTCTEAGLNSPWYLNFATAIYENGCALTLGNIVIGGNNNNNHPSPIQISATITTPVANCWVYGTIDNNDNGQTGVVTWSGQLTQLDFTYVSDGVDGDQADSNYAAAGTYTITSTDFGASNVWMSIALICVKPTCVLPVELLNFDCNSTNNGIQLNWSTATETNSGHFTIERSTDGIQFSPIATMPAAGNSESNINYTYLDAHPLSGVNYYRLTETDLDGSSQSFNISSCSNNAYGSEIYPNPNQGTFTLTLDASSSYQTLTVYDLLGKQVFEKQFPPSVNPGSYIISLPSDLKGIYMASVQENDQLKTVKKLVIY